MKTLKFDKKTLKVRRISSALGAEILGIQLAKLDVQGVSLIENLLMEHKVLLFPNQNLSIDEHLAFGSLFGDLEAHPHYENPITKNEKIFELAIDSGADECFSYNYFHEIHCSKGEIYNVKKKIETKIQNFISAEIEWKPLNTVEVSKDVMEVAIEFLETLENDDDVQSVYTNLKFVNN